MSSGYRKFSSRFDVDKSKTFASFATFADGGQNFDTQPDTEKAKVDPPKIQNASVKVAQVAKVETLGVVCVVCKAPDDLWQFGEALVHQECAALLPRPECAEPTAAYESASAGPDGAGCKVTIVEIPREAGRYKRTFAALQLRPPALVDVARWRQCVEDGRAFLAKWGAQAESFGWDSRDLFGLAPVPAKPHPSYNRLSRYDATGLIWLLQGRPVVALAKTTAAIQSATGTITTYRRLTATVLGRPRSRPLERVPPSSQRRSMPRSFLSC
jgi:hypothetical protein